MPNSEKEIILQHLLQERKILENTINLYSNQRLPSLQEKLEKGIKLENTTIF